MIVQQISANNLIPYHYYTLFGDSGKSWAKYCLELDLNLIQAQAGRNMYKMDVTSQIKSF